MNKIILMMSVLAWCVLAGPVRAQETVNAVAADVSINSAHEAVQDAIPEIMNAENAENLEMVNDEGYGAEDTEYYGADEELNAQDNSEEEEPDVTVNGAAK